MKIKRVALIVLSVICLCLVACGEAKRPIDYPNTSWTCESANITFSVSEDGKITNASLIDKNGNTVSISLVFSEISEAKVSITSPDESEVYLLGTCTYDSDSFSVFVTDIYNSDINVASTRLTFKRS